MLPPTGGKRGGPGKVPPENAGGPLLIKLLGTPVWGTGGGALIGGEVKGLGLGLRLALGRAPRVGGGGGPSGRAGGEPPGGGTPDNGAAGAPPRDDEKELCGAAGLIPNAGG